MMPATKPTHGAGTGTGTDPVPGRKILRARRLQRAAASPASPAAAQLAAMAPRVLGIKGFAMAEDWMEAQLIGVGTPDIGLHGDPRAAAAWKNVELDWVDFNYGETGAAIEQCKAAVCSGRYHCIVCIDLSLFEGPDSAAALFERHVGPLLRSFADKGGAVAFPTSEGGLIQPTLRRLFGTTWERSGYYRTVWSHASGDVASSFGTAAPATFSAKVGSIRNVPAAERMYGVTPDSVTQSHVPCMAGRPVGQRKAPGAAQGTPAADADYVDHDVCVAVHSVGAGSIAFFGDVNMEAATSELVAAYLRTRAPGQPIAVALPSQPQPQPQPQPHPQPQPQHASGTSPAAATAPPKVKPPALTEHAQWATGVRVELRDLKSATHLNGRAAHVLGFDETNGRLAVELELAKAGERHSMKANGANLKPLPALPRTVAALQQLVDAAASGDRVSIPSGTFTAPSGATLVIRSAITLQGQGHDSSVLGFPVAVDEGASGTRLHLAKFRIDGATLKVGGAALQQVRLSHVHVHAPLGPSDALVLGKTGGGHATDRILVTDCEVTGGGDGVMIAGAGVRLLRCRVLGAADRGIFANPDFVIEDSVVQGCGGYGMKTRGGCERRGRNNIQAGPWDGHLQFGEGAPPFGTGTDGMGMGMGDFAAAMNFESGHDQNFDDDDDDDVADDARGAYGFTEGETMELLSQGVKPWDDDAHAVLDVLHGNHY